jgi:hypothetical protein
MRINWAILYRKSNGNKSLEGLIRLVLLVHFAKEIASCWQDLMSQIYAATILQKPSSNMDLYMLSCRWRSGNTVQRLCVCVCEWFQKWDKMKQKIYNNRITLTFLWDGLIWEQMRRFRCKTKLHNENGFNQRNRWNILWVKTQVCVGVYMKWTW